MAEIEFNRQARIHIWEKDDELGSTRRSHHITFGVQYPNGDYEDYNGYLTNAKSIISGSQQLTKIMSESGIQLGALISSEYRCQVYVDYLAPIPGPVIDKGLQLQAGQYIECIVGDYDADTDTFSNEIRFSGIIDSCKADIADENLYTIVAYDWVYYSRDKDISSWWTEFWSDRNSASPWALMLNFYQATDDNPAFVRDYTDRQMTYDMFTDLPNFTQNINKPESIQGILTMGQFLSWLGEYLGVMFDPYISQWNVLKLVKLDETQTALDLTNPPNIEKGASDTESYVTEPISGFALYKNGEKQTSVGTDDNVYKIFDNTLINNAKNVNTVLTNLYESLDEVVYTPCQLKLIVSNPIIMLGDRIYYTVALDNTRYYYSRVFQIIYSGTLFVDQQIICNALGEKLQQEDTTKYGSDVDLTDIEQQLQHLEDDTVKVDPKLQTMSGEDLLTQDDEQILVKIRNNITDILADYVTDDTLDATVVDLLSYIREHDSALSDRIDACVTSTELTNTLTSYLLKSKFDETMKHYIWSSYMQYANPSNFIVLRTVDPQYNDDEIVRVSFAKNMGVVHMSIVLKVYAPIGAGDKIFGINDFASMQYQLDRLTAQYAFDTMGSVGANQTAGARSFYFRPSDENDTTQGDVENVSYVINTYDAITPPSGSFTYIRLSATWLVLDEEE